MTIKITCAGSDSWYRNLIGTVWEIEQTDKPYQYKLTNEDKYILRCHCVEI